MSDAWKPGEGDFPAMVWVVGRSENLDYAYVRWLDSHVMLRSDALHPMPPQVDAAAVREECARIADAHADECREAQRVTSDWEYVHQCLAEEAMARTVGRSIRAQIVATPIPDAHAEFKANILSWVMGGWIDATDLRRRLDVLNPWERELHDLACALRAALSPKPVDPVEELRSAAEAALEDAEAEPSGYQSDTHRNAQRERVARLRTALAALKAGGGK